MPHSAAVALDRLRQLQASLPACSELTLNELQPVLWELTYLLRELPAARSQVGLTLLLDLQAEHAVAGTYVPREESQRWLNRGLRAVLTQALRE
ncbi:hypothetical protein [Hymenobacter latericus]|uniref:hypothetical protein n=1 Tax=Hymenobacter sp. YIM 151858-1 TaxID=2987688 RepID=UPI0022260DA6|nr:hypothetical protein [Hymenobacter sp. YIM 151858-1]UYZ61143.1 hypothetical protein OIS50_19430 [Hymenobacter sp. YIM 151858-1]